MNNLNFLQQLTLVLYTFQVLLIFFYSWFKRRRISLGSFETTILPLAVILYFVSILHFKFSDNIGVLAVGLIIYVCGSVLGAISFRSLGWVNSDDFWFARNEKKERYIAMRGPYKYFRHPLFVSLALQYLGLVIVFFHPISLTIWMAAVVLGIITSLKEEKFMQTRFPEYRDYANRTGRFIPKFK